MSDPAERDHSSEQEVSPETGAALCAAIDNLEKFRPDTHLARTGEFRLPSGEVHENAYIKAYVFFPPKHSETPSIGSPDDPYPGDFRLIHFEVMENQHAKAISDAKDAVMEVWRVVNPEDTYFVQRGKLNLKDGTLDVEEEYENPYGQYMTRTEEQEHIARAFTAVVKAVDNAMPRLYSSAFVECNDAVVEIAEIPRMEEEYGRLVDDIGAQMLTSESGDDPNSIKGAKPASESIVRQLTDHLKYELEIS